MLEVSDLTNSEVLLLWRRRNDYTQPEAAVICDITERDYRDWEKGRIDKDPEVDLETPLDDIEICMLLRRRKGWTQTQLAKRMGRTITTVINMENGGTAGASVKALVEFWRGELDGSTT